MNRDASLPTEFAELNGKVSFIQRKSNQEYCSACPKCGGAIHSDGEWPDRFVMLMRSTATGGAFGFCRMCGYKFIPGRSDGAAVSPETLALLEQQAQAYRDKLAAERKAKLAQFTTGELWTELHARMQEEQREWWKAQGIPVDWQDYLRLGYTPKKIYTGNDGNLLESPAYTIPYFHDLWQFCTMQYRLCNPENPQDRYRFEAGLGTTYYMVTPSQKIKPKVVICEGAKKAIVACLHSGLSKEISFLGVPSKEDWRSVVEVVKQCERVWIILDPDCWQVPERPGKNWKPAPVSLAEAVGKNARIVDMSEKVDDAFIKMGMDEGDFKACLDYGRRL